MRKTLILGTAAAVVGLASLVIPLPASAWCYHCYPPPVKKVTPQAPGSSSTGKFVVGCIMGSALGLIAASVVKGGGIKWMTQKEWEDLKVKVPNPLTNDEAWMIASTCGLAAFAVRPAQAAPVVVRAGG